MVGGQETFYLFFSADQRFHVCLLVVFDCDDSFHVGRDVVDVGADRVGRGGALGDGVFEEIGVALVGY